MWTKLKLWLSNPAENLWVQPTLGALFALFFSVLAATSGELIPDDWVLDIKPDTLLNLLDIISSSMLAVTTFSLSIMVSALSATASSATPRARLLVISDSSTRLAITSFITAFIYSIIAKIALGLKYYGASGRFVMFVGTLLVLAYLVFTLIRWVQTLSNLGSMSDTLKKIEVVAAEGLAWYRQHADLGIIGQKPSTGLRAQVSAGQTGYVTHIDLAGLNAWAKKHHCHVHITHRLNDFIGKDDVLFEIFPQKQCSLTTEEAWQTAHDDIRDKALIQADRAHHQDPVYGLTVLAEVGHRALSASVNDPSTAERTMSLMTRLLIDTQAKQGEHDEFEWLSICPFDIPSFANVYFSLARDGADNADFIAHTLHCLGLLHRYSPEPQLREAAALTAGNIYLMAHERQPYQHDIALLNQVWQQQFGQWQADASK